MNIGFYGHSNCAHRGEHSFLDIVANKFNGTVVNTGVRQGSEERILYELKKTKNLDLAIIFHSRPSFVFLPNSDRDLEFNNVKEHRIQYLLNEFEKDFTSKLSPIFKKEFESTEYLKHVVELFQKHFYNPDMILNRYYGSLMQIDKYLLDKQIPCIHILEKDSLPKWFSFQTGIVDFSIMKIVEKHKLEYGKYFVNIITKEGNLEVADKLSQMTKELIGGSYPPAPGAVA